MTWYPGRSDPWRPFITYCPNCSKKLIGYCDETGMARIQCNSCMTEIKRKRMGRKHDRIDLYAPEGMTNDYPLDGELPFY